MLLEGTKSVAKELASDKGASEEGRSRLDLSV